MIQQHQVVRERQRERQLEHQNRSRTGKLRAKTSVHHRSCTSKERTRTLAMAVLGDEIGGRERNKEVDLGCRGREWKEKDEELGGDVAFSKLKSWPGPGKPRRQLAVFQKRCLRPTVLLTSAMSTLRLGPPVARSSYFRSVPTNLTRPNPRSARQSSFIGKKKTYDNWMSFTAQLICLPLSYEVSQRQHKPLWCKITQCSCPIQAFKTARGLVYNYRELKAM